MHSIQLILDDDKASRKKDQRTNLWATPLQVILLPVLFWVTAIGKTPMVRAGYGLMAAGLAISLFAVWIFENWSRQALPGPVDMRTQLQKAAFLLSRQASLARSSPLWSAPLFVGGALIGTWAYQNRGLGHALALWLPLAFAFATLVRSCLKKAGAAEQQRARMEELLRDLS